MKQKSGSHEKVSRRWERFKVNVRVTVSLTRDGTKLEFSGTAHDISTGGMALFLTKELRVGETVFITFSLPYSKDLGVYGVIRNRANFEYGVEFRSVSSQVKADLERNCRALALLNAESAPEY